MRVLSCCQVLYACSTRLRFHHEVEVSEQQTRESLLLPIVLTPETLNQLQASAASMISVSPAQSPVKRFIFPKRIVNLNFKDRQHGGNTVEAQATTLRRITDFVRVLVAA